MVLIFLTFDSYSGSCDAPWDATTTYAVAGLKVSHGGVNYISNYWTKGDTPPHGAWAKGLACTSDPGPSVTSSAATLIGGSYARFNGEVTNGNGSGVDAMGFIYYTVESNVDLASIGTLGLCSVVSHGTPAVTVYNIDVANLERNQDYFYKSYATNVDGTTYGAVKTFSTTNTGITFTSNADGAWGTTTIWTPNGTPNLDGAAPHDTVIINNNVTHTGSFQIEDGNVLQTTASGNLTLTGSITQGISGVTGSILNAGTITGSGTYTPTGANGIFSNSGTFEFATWDGANSWNMGNTGNIITTGAFTHNGSGTLISVAGALDVNSFTVGPSGAAVSLASTSLTVATNLTVAGSGVVNTDVNSVVNIGGNYTNSGSVSSTFGGATSVTGDYTNTGSATITVGGAMTVGGDVSGSGSGNLTINGSLDITGELSLTGSALLNGAGVLKWNTLNVRGQSSTGYVVCVDFSKYDSEAGANAADIPANPFDLASCGVGVLPVELLLFEAVDKGDLVDVTWVTGSELNSELFEVLVSEDGLNWNVLSVVQAAGNSTSVLTYQLNDYEVEGYSQKYYRIVEVGVNGVRYYSPVKVVNFSSEGRIISYYDNGSNVVLVHDVVGTSVICSLYDIQGELVSVQSTDGLKDGIGKVLVSSVNLVSGMYLVSMNVDNKLFSKKILINKSNVQ